jgi:tRNA modification GTPase
LSLLLAEVVSHEETRLAAPGEFTRRAFVAGKLDLARAEAVADLIAAESEAQVQAAAAQLHGGLSERVREVKELVLGVLAEVEGVLDFPDEAEGAEVGIGLGLERVGAALSALLEDGARGVLVRRGARVVLYGAVNAGKSTLFNRLAGVDRALVDPEPGTTRDTLEARLELAGLSVTLVDTAGLREAAGRLEAMGIARAREALAGADLALLVVPPEAGGEAVEVWRREVEAARRFEVTSKVDLGRERSLGGGDERAAPRVYPGGR